MKTYRFKDLGIISANLPITNDLFLEIDQTNGRLILVDSVDRTKVYYSSDKGANWTQMDVDPSDSSGDNKSRDMEIRSAWHDVDNEIIWFVDCDYPSDDFDVWKLDYSTWGSFSITEIGTSAGADNASVYTHDIFMIGTDVFVYNFEARGAVNKLVVWEVDTAPFTEEDVQNIADGKRGWKGYVTGTVYYSFVRSSVINELTYDDDGTTLSINAGLAGYTYPDTESQWGVSYDGSNIALYVAKSLGDGKPYLIEYNITGDSHTVLAEYNIALMLDRNNVGSVPNEYEKGFQVGGLKTYEITPRGGLVQLQDLASFPSTVGKYIIAITDHFIMLDDD